MTSLSLESPCVLSVAWSPLTHLLPLECFRKVTFTSGSFATLTLLPPDVDPPTWLSLSLARPPHRFPDLSLVT